MLLCFDFIINNLNLKGFKVNSKENSTRVQGLVKTRNKGQRRSCLLLWESFRRLREILCCFSESCRVSRSISWHLQLCSWFCCQLFRFFQCRGFLRATLARTPDGGLLIPQWISRIWQANSQSVQSHWHRRSCSARSSCQCRWCLTQ